MDKTGEESVSYLFLSINMLLPLFRISSFPLFYSLLFAPFLIFVLKQLIFYTIATEDVEFLQQNPVGPNF